MVSYTLQFYYIGSFSVVIVFSYSGHGSTALWRKCLAHGSHRRIGSCLKSRMSCSGLYLDHRTGKTVICNISPEPACSGTLRPGRREQLLLLCSADCIRITRYYILLLCTFFFFFRRRRVRDHI